MKTRDAVEPVRGAKGDAAREALAALPATPTTPTASARPPRAPLCASGEGTPIGRWVREGPLDHHHTGAEEPGWMAGISIVARGLGRL
ncbi:hypothetical protein [Arthrobacter sp. 2MCAF14]|uniref:hypothetical protein n=1 Tax=Arthrobacter sp. 2MCAF14 TaxID=3232982 RepID=UPI003F9179F4